MTKWKQIDSARDFSEVDYTLANNKNSFIEEDADAANELNERILSDLSFY